MDRGGYPIKGLIDSTLREGEQMAGVYFTLEQKVDIVRRLGQVGIEEMELGVVSADDPEISDLLARATQEAPVARLALWCRCLPRDIEAGIRLRPDVLSISLPISDLHLQKRLQKDRPWVLSQLTSAVAQARAGGIPYISLGLEDATRTDPEFFWAVCRHAAAVGVDRVRLADTLGVLTPTQLARMVKRCKQEFPLEIGVHTHNDFGMATANTIEALEAGADWADVSVLGLGERAGIARLEEVIGYLRLMRGRSQYDTTQLIGLCKAISRATSIPIYPHHPIAGRRIFACESGLHLDGLAKDSATYEPYPPERVQGTRKISLGKKAGHNAVLIKLRDLGVEISREEISCLVPRLRSVSRGLGRPLSDGEVLQLVAEMTGHRELIRKPL